MDLNPYESPQHTESASSAPKTSRPRKLFHWIFICIWLVVIGTTVFSARLSWLEFQRSGFVGGAGLSPHIYWTFKVAYPLFMWSISGFTIVRAWYGLPEIKPNRKPS